MGRQNPDEGVLWCGTDIRTSVRPSFPSPSHAAAGIGSRSLLRWRIYAWSRTPNPERDDSELYYKQVPRVDQVEGAIKCQVLKLGKKRIKATFVCVDDPTALEYCDLLVKELEKLYPGAVIARPIHNDAATTASEPGMPIVFISYSHADEMWKNRLAKQLNVLEGIRVLESWDDRKVGAGEDWEREIEKAMDNAFVAILLISADFLSSDFITKKEVPRLLARREAGELRVIPVIVKPCQWKRVPWLEAIQALPTDGRPLSQATEAQAEENLAIIAGEIIAIMEQTVGIENSCQQHAASHSAGQVI